MDLLTTIVLCQDPNVITDTVDICIQVRIAVAYTGFASPQSGLFLSPFSLLHLFKTNEIFCKPCFRFIGGALLYDKFYGKPAPFHRTKVACYQTLLRRKCETHRIIGLLLIGLGSNKISNTRNSHLYQILEVLNLYIKQNFRILSFDL